MPQAVNTRHAAGKPGVDYHLLHAEPHAGQPQVHHAAVFAKIDGLGAVQCNVAAHVGPAVDFTFGEVVDAAVLTEMDGKRLICRNLSYLAFTTAPSFVITPRSTRKGTGVPSGST